MSLAIGFMVQYISGQINIYDISGQINIYDKKFGPSLKKKKAVLSVLIYLYM